MISVLAAAFICANAAPVDGDTISCGNGVRARLWGVDSPELSTPTGPPATHALATLIAGKTLHCIVKGPKSYSRVVAQCFVNGRDVAGEMVRGGWAVDWPKFSGGYYRVDR